MQEMWGIGEDFRRIQRKNRPRPSGLVKHAQLIGKSACTRGMPLLWLLFRPSEPFGETEWQEFIGMKPRFGDQGRVSHG